MPNRRVTIKAVDAVKCIRSGMDDAALMQEFNVSASGLQSLFTQLVAAGILRRSELEQPPFFVPRICNCRPGIG